MSLALPEALLFVGVDWAAAEHAVCVMDATGKIVSQFMIKHSADGIAVLVRRLAKLGDAADIPIASERPNGRLVDLLLEAGHPVVPVKPNAIKTWREGEVLSGAKSDAGDAAVIAEYMESSISLAFLSRYPTPVSAAHVGEKRMAAFCVKHSYSGRRPAVELLFRLRQPPAGTTDPALTEALRDAVLAMVGVLHALGTAIKDLDRSSAAQLGEHPDGKLFTSLPRSGQINAAQMLAEWGDCRQAYDGPDSVASLAGCTPVTKASGNSRHASPWAAKIYRDALAAGKDHQHAVRVLARAWIRVIWRCWLDQVPYDPAKHGGFQRQTTLSAA